MDPETGAESRTFRAADDADPPKLEGVKGVARAEDGTRLQFETVYFDTAGLALTAAGITLRRRTGGDDAGWTLELTEPDGAGLVLGGTGGGGDVVPEPLRDAVRLYTRSEALVPIGRTRTERSDFTLLDKSGGTLARLLDDRVTASAAAPEDTGQLLAWREWTAARVGGKPAVLDQLSALLEANGATPSPDEADVARILGDRAPARDAPAAPRLRRKSPASDVVAARLREQVAELEHWDVLTRWEAPDSIHKMRVATRRLRSALATFRPLLHREQTDPVRDELRWIAGLLGRARDAEVSREYLAERIAAEPVELMIGAVAQHVDRELSAEYREARNAALEAMNSDRYFALVDRLRAVVANPPWSGTAGKRAGKVLPARVAADYKRTRKHVAAAEAEHDPEARATALHEARKSAKRARYAAETLAPVYGAPAEQFATAAERVQEVLGDHHDAISRLPRLRQLGVQAHLDGENAFSYGRLHALEQARIGELEAEYQDAWAAASAKKLRRWLK